MTATQPEKVDVGLFDFKNSVPVTFDFIDWDTTHVFFNAENGTSIGLQDQYIYNINAKKLNGIYNYSLSSVVFKKTIVFKNDNSDIDINKGEWNELKEESELYKLVLKIADDWQNQYKIFLKEHSESDK